MLIRLASGLCAAAVFNCAAAMEPFTRELTTCLGGNSLEQARGVVVDYAGNRIVVGGTQSSDFPVTFGPDFQTGGGKAIVYATLLGGSGDDSCRIGDVDQNGAIHIAGQSSSSNLPGLNAPIFGGKSGAD